MSNEIEEIKEQREKWIAAVNAGEVENYLALLTDDIVWFPPGMPAVAGKDSMREWLAPFFRDYDYEFSISDISDKISGGWAVEHGRFNSVLTPKKGGEAMSHGGKYIVIWRREKDEAWRIERYIDDTEGFFLK